MTMVRTGGVAEALHDRGREAWATATGHPMVREIGAGTLPHATFLRYFTQNVLYLEEYARAIAIVASKAPDGEALTTLTEFQMQIVAHEIPANVRFLERLGGTPDRRGGRGAMLPTTYAYTSHLLAACALGDAADGLTAVLPCQWSYGELARPLMQELPADPIYADWIAMFGNDAYGELVDRTTALLDRLAGPVGDDRLATLSQIFDRSTRYEVAFWDMAYGDGSAGTGAGTGEGATGRGGT